MKELEKKGKIVLSLCCFLSCIACGADNEEYGHCSVVTQREEFGFLALEHSSLIHYSFSKDSFEIPLSSTLPMGMRWHDYSVCKNKVLFKASVQSNEDLLWASYDLDSCALKLYWPKFAIDAKKVSAFDLFTTNAFFCVLNDDGTSDVFSYSFKEKKIVKLCDVVGEVVRCSISPNGAHLGLLVSTDSLSKMSFVVLYSFETGSQKRVDADFAFIKGVLPNNGLYWAPNSQKLLVAAVNVCDESLENINGHFTTINVQEGSSTSFGIGYFGGWLDSDSILVTTMPSYKLSIFDPEGHERMKFLGKKIGFVLVADNSTLLVIKSIDADHVRKKHTSVWDTSGNVLYDLPESFQLPFDGWRYGH